MMFETGWAGVGQLILAVWGIGLLVPTGVYLIPRALSRAVLAEDRDKGIINGSVNRSTAVAVREPDPTEE